MRQGPLGRVHQQNGTVSHGKGALNLTTEIGMAGCVDDVDSHTFPYGRTVFGRDGDAAFALEIHGVHEPVVHNLAVPEEAALTKHGIHECCFAMIDMGNNGNISQVVVLLRCFRHLFYPCPILQKNKKHYRAPVVIR